MNVRECMRLCFALCALLAAPVAAQDVYKCGNTYTDKPCEEGQLVDATPAVAEANMTTIYRCDPVYAKPFWVAKACSTYGGVLNEIDRARVPAHMDLHQQVDYLYQQRAKQKNGTR